MPPSCACRHAWPAAGARAGGSARAVSKDIPAEIAVMYSPLGAGVRWAVHLGRAGLGSTVLVLGAGRRESPAASARRYWYDTCVFDRRAIRYLIGILGPGRLLVGTGFPAMPRETSPGTTASASSESTSRPENHTRPTPSSPAVSMTFSKSRYAAFTR